MRRIVFVLLAGFLILSTQLVRAEVSCADPEKARSSPTWKAFIRVFEAHYLSPRGLLPSDLPTAALAKIMGHALGRQAPHVGDDAGRRAAYACLESGIGQGLDQVRQVFTVAFGLTEAAGSSEDLRRLVREAAIGFYDNEVAELTGVGPGDGIPSIFDGAGAASGDDWKPQTPPAPGKPETPPAPGRRCRFNLHPSLYTAAHPAYEWYLLRRPWKGDGDYYDTVEVNPEWPPDHPKRPENRLAPQQTIVLKGTKEEVRERAGELRRACRE